VAIGVAPRQDPAPTWRGCIQQALQKTARGWETFIGVGSGAARFTAPSGCAIAFKKAGESKKSKRSK
jgi:hypothetical protein